MFRIKSETVIILLVIMTIIDIVCIGALTLYTNRKAVVYETFENTHGITNNYVGNLVMQDNGNIKLVKSITNVKEYK